MTDLAKLVVKLEAESAKLHKDLDRANKKLGRFERSAGGAGKAIKQMAAVSGVALGLVAGGVIAMGKSMLDAADKIGKLSQSTGLASETLSRLKYMSDLSGVSFEQLTKGVGRLQRSMYDANSGLKTQADAFTALGVSVTDANGSLRSSESVMLDVADKFQQMKDGAEKAALAQILFGKAGVSMIPFLNQGRAGIKAMADEADALGITMSGKLTAAAERTNDNLTRLSTAIQGVFLRVMEQALPYIEDMTKAMVKWAKEPGKVAEAMIFLNDVLKVFRSTGIIISTIFEALGRSIGATAAAMMSVAKGEFKQAFNIIQMAAEDNAKTYKEAVESMAHVWEEMPKKIESKAKDVGEKMASPIIEADKQIGKTKADIDKKIDAIKNKLLSAKDEAKSINKEFADRASNLAGGKKEEKDPRKLNVLDVSLMQRQSERALNNGDFDGALDKARQAFDLLDKMKEAGVESDIVLRGMGERLKGLGEKIGSEKIAKIPMQYTADLQSAEAAAAWANNIAQQWLDKHPLVQKIVTEQAPVGITDNAPTGIKPSSVPNESTQKQETKSPLQPVNVTMPNGSTVPFYGDKAAVDQLLRDISRESLKRGARA
jgi:hypothetical protein